MATPIQQLMGTAAEVAAKTYAQGLLIWNETAKRFHGGDGVTAGGIPMARYDERNDGSLGYEQRIETDASNAVTVADLGKAIIGNRATAIAFNLDPAASLTSKFTAVFKNIGAGTMSIVPNGAQLIDGVNAAVTLPTGASVVLKGDGTSLRTYLSNADVTGAAINNAPPLTGANLADTDKLGVFDLSAAALVGMTIAEFVAGLFSRAGAAINALMGKTTPVDADLLLLGDSAASFASKKLTFANLWTWVSGKVLTLFNASGSAPVYACRAWVAFTDTGSVAVLSSGNVTSVVRISTGVYEITMTTALADTNYAVMATPRDGGYMAGQYASPKTTTVFRVSATTDAGALANPSVMNVMVIR